MNGIILNFLISTINGKIQHCKERLEVEEKSKEVAFLQGNISGYKNLIGYLSAEFGLTQVFIEVLDEPQSLPELDSHYIKDLFQDLKALLSDERWEKVRDSVVSKTLELKDTLLFEASSARDLYIIQAHHQGITVYQDIFQNIENEVERQSGELDFSNGESAIEIATKIASEAGKLGEDE